MQLFSIPTGAIRFRTRIFIAIFFSSSIVGSFVLSLSYFYAKEGAKQQFHIRYENLVKIIGNTILANERGAETSMKNGAYVIRGTKPEGFTYSTEQLKKIREGLDLTHIFIIGMDGTFIRSTNEDPELIPNIFSFCDSYRTLYSQRNAFEATPIIPPSPEPNPYKFLTIPDFSGKYLIHVAKRVDFIGELLQLVMNKDENLIRLELFSPNGTSLGSFSRDNFELGRVTDSSVPDQEDEVKELDDHITVMSSWVDSAHVNCCQCKTFKNTRNGNYQYLIRAHISTLALSIIYRDLFNVLLVGEGLAIIFSLFLAALISRKIVARLQHLTSQIGGIQNDLSNLKKFDESGSDEISILSRAFNRLLQKITASNIQIIELEKRKIVAELAARLAHDIRSPLSAIRIIIESPPITKDHLDLLKRAFDRVNALTVNLLNHYKGFETKKMEIVDLIPLVEELIAEIKISRLYNSELTFNKALVQNSNCRTIGNRAEIARAISNLINNAVEAVPEKGSISFSVYLEDSKICLEIKDNGIGMPPEVVMRLGVDQISYGKDKSSSSGSGLGFLSAKRSLEEYGASILVESSPETGTTVRIMFNPYKP